MLGSGTSSGTNLLPLSLLKRYSSSKKMTLFVKKNQLFFRAVKIVSTCLSWISHKYTQLSPRL